MEEPLGLANGRVAQLGERDVGGHVQLAPRLGLRRVATLLKKDACARSKGLKEKEVGR